MIRTALIGAVVAGFCLTLAACDSGDPGGDPAKEARRPAPTEQIKAPGPDLSGAEQKKEVGAGG